MNAHQGISVHIVEYVQKLNKAQKRLIWMIADLSIYLLAGLLSYLFFLTLIDVPVVNYAVYIASSFIIYLALSHFFQVSTRINRYSGIIDIILLFIISMLSSAIGGLLCTVILNVFSFRYTILSMIVSALGVVGIRTIWQMIYLSKYRSGITQEEVRNIVLIGAGDGGSLFMNSYRRNKGNMNVIAILDSNPETKGQNIGGIPVIGDTSIIPELAAQHRNLEAIVAIPSLSPTDYERILQICNQNNVTVYKMPKVEDVILGVHQTKDTMTKVNISDLLGRKEIELDETKLRSELEGKTILITGAGGSIGSEISRQVSRFNPKRVLLLGHGENSIYLIYHELIKNQSFTEYVPVIADVQDYDRILDIFKKEKPDIVYHAAAHKHVPLMESNPVEAFKNNILGTYNIAKAVDAAKLPKMVMISTDKAVNPPNVMGATKRVAELIVTGMNKNSDSIYCAVRFGNVLGSRGSVIPVFEKQIAEGGPITVTDFRMTRYFMTIPEASRLVIYAGANAAGSEVFILDMGDPVKIVDLAKKMILLSGHTEEDINIVESGIRPGEKLYEELLTSSELVGNQLNEKIFIGEVAQMPINEIDSFIQELYQSINDSRKIKEKIIIFANDSAN